MKTKTKLFSIIFVLIVTSFSTAQSYDELIKQGEDKFHSGDYPGSIESFRKAVKAKPNNTFGLFSLGYVLGLRGMHDEGISYLDKAIKIAPDSIQYNFYRGEIKGYKGDYKGAIEDMLYYKNNVRENPEATYILLSQYYYDAKDYKNAQLYIDKAEEALNPLPFNFYYNKARIELKNRDYLKAIQNATKGINLNPNYPHTYFTRGKALFEAGKYDKSIKDYDAYLKIIPTDDIAISNRALAKQNAGDLNAALSDYSKAISLYDQDAVTFINRSVLYRKMNKNDLALADLNKASKLAPNYFKTFNLRGNLYLNQKKYTEALADFNKAIKLNSKSVADLTSRSYCYLKLNKPEQALTDAKKALELDKTNSDAFLHAGLSSFNLNKFDQAIKYYTDGIVKNPDDGRLYYGRSAAYKENGNHSLAANDDAKAKTLLSK